MLVPDNLTSNAFRVLRVSVSATSSEVHKAAAALKRAAALGVPGDSGDDIPSLGEVARGEAELRMAVGRLEQPKQRVRERLFWFHAAPNSAPTALEASGALLEFADTARNHDAALHQLFAALDSPPAARRTSWIDALMRWHELVSSSSYGLLLEALEEHSGFEPRALASELQAVREDATRAAAEPLSIFAREAWVRDDRAAVLEVLAILFELESTGAWALHTQEELLAPALQPLESSCQHSRDEHSAKVVRKPGRAAENRVPCAAASAHYRAHIEPALAKVLGLVPAHHPAARQARELAAKQLQSMASDLTWAEDFEAADGLLSEALQLLRDTPSALQVEQRRIDIRAAALSKACSDNRKQYGANIVRSAGSAVANRSWCVAAIAHHRAWVAPALADVRELVEFDHAVAKRACQLAGENLEALAADCTWAEDFAQAQGLLLEALELARGTESAARIQQKLQRIDSNARNQRVLGGLKPVEQAPSLFTFNGIGFRLYGATDDDSQTRSYVSTLYFVVLYVPIFPIARYRVIPAGRGYRFLGQLPLTRGNYWISGTSALTALGLFALAAMHTTPHSYQTSTDGAADRTLDVREASWNLKQAHARAAAQAPSPDRLRISFLESQIAKCRTEFDQLDGKLKPVANELESMQRSIDLKKVELDGMRRLGAVGMHVNGAEFESKRKAYNVLVRKSNNLKAANKTDIERYEQLRSEGESLVAQYNSLLAGSR
jgi:hypothetical protein